MSVITGISAAGPQASPATITPQLGSASASPAPVTGDRVDPPAVIVSLSPTATASANATSTPRSLDLNKVDDALSWTAGANGFAYNAVHFDYAGTLAKFGQAIADRNRATVTGAAVGSASFALSYASSLGIPIKDSVSPEDVKKGAAPGTISVGAFSFTNGGSTYAVTPGKDGTLVGTKDGQAWKTWQSNSATPNAGTTAALQVLTSLNAQNSLNAQKAPTYKPATGLNVAA